MSAENFGRLVREETIPVAELGLGIKNYPVKKLLKDLGC